MSTKLGAVEVPIKLDFSQVEREIQRVAAKINRDVGGAEARLSGGGSATRPTPAVSASDSMALRDSLFGGNALRAAGYSRHGTGFSEPIESGAAGYRKGGRKSIAFGDEEDDETRGVARRTLQNYKRLVPGNSVTSAASSLMGYARFLPQSMQDTARTVGGTLFRAATIYAIASGTAKILPESMAFGNALAGDKSGVTSPDPTVAALQQAVESLRRGFAWIETRITGSYAAFGKQRAVNEASLRLGGELPTDNERLRSMFTEEERTSKLMESQFEMWKSREAPFVVPRMLFDTFKRQLNR